MMKLKRRCMLTPAQHRRRSFLAKRQQGQNGKWETNKRKANAKVVVSKTAKIPFFAQTQQQIDARKKFQVRQARQARKFANKLRNACDSAELALLLPKLKRLKLAPAVFHCTQVGEALADAKKRVKPSPAVARAVALLLERWALDAAEPPSVSVARQREADTQPEPTQECPGPASSQPTLLEAARRAPRQAKLGVNRIKALTEEQKQVKQTAQLLAFLEDEGRRSKGGSKRKRDRFAISVVRNALDSQRRGQEARAKATGVDATGELLFSQPVCRVRGKSSPSCSAESSSSAAEAATSTASVPEPIPLADAAPEAPVAATPPAKLPATRLPDTGKKQQKLTGFFGVACGGASSAKGSSSGSPSKRT